MPPKQRTPVKAGDDLLTKQAYTFSTRMATFGTNEINGGAVAAGDQRTFDQSAINNSISKPFWVTRVKFFVGRVAGGDEVDSDYDEISVLVSGSSQDMKYNRQFTALSTLLDRQRREWLLQPGRLVFGWQNGGANVDLQCVQFSRGAPYNVTVTFHGYLETYARISQADLPPEAGF